MEISWKCEVGQVFKDYKRDLIIIDRVIIKNSKNYNIKRYKYKCNKCGFECGGHYRNQEHKEELWVTEGNILKYNGCACCNNKIVVEGINDIPTTAPWMVKYFQGGYDEAKMYACGSHKKIHPICPDCGRVNNKSIEVASIYNVDSIRCICKNKNKKYPEKFIFSLLEQLNLSFKKEFSPKWCEYIDFNDINKIKTGRYDFLLEDYNIIIETDGGWHNKDNNLSGQTKEESEYIDFTKDKLAKENGYEVIRIDCDYKHNSRFEYIKQNLLNSKLNKLFDLSDINWNNICIFCNSDVLKSICNLKNANNNIKTSELSYIFKLHKSTIIDYLKQGTKLGLCNYDAKEEMIKNITNNNKKQRKQIEVFKDEISLGIFRSLSYLCEKSKDIFGTKFLASHVSKVCNGKKEQYKGYTFKYIGKELV